MQLKYNHIFLIIWHDREKIIYKNHVDAVMLHAVLFTDFAGM
jgi:hypothetical protein